MGELPKGTGGFLNPQTVLNQLDIKASYQVAHFGCGHGYFTIPMAQMVGKDGRIFAIDILNEALIEVEVRAEQSGLTNIETLKGNLEVPGGSKLPFDAMDIVLLANILFQSQKKSDIIKEARRVLKPGGELIIIDWQTTSSTLTSDSGWRISPDEAQQLAQEQNFAFIRSFDAGNYHYGLLLRKF